MKTKLLSFLAFCCAINAFAQTDGWHLFTKASEITKILPDDINVDELHLATDIGYIKYNTSTDMVVDFLNLTSQNPAIGNVKDIALDPTSNDIALALKDGIAIYDGSAVTVYSYATSDLTIGESTSQFISPKVDYAKDGSLYIYKEDALGYQKFNNGSFETEMVTSFRPQDIVENSDGTKAYFAGDNNGLWELDKTADTWANYTASNSDLFQNFLTSLCFDSSDNLYIGNYQGIDKLDTSGSFTSCNDGTPIPVFDININPINGELLVRNSRLNSASNFGLSIVDFDSCSWTNYREDGLNCLNENALSACGYDSNGEMFVAPTDFSDPGKFIHFNPGNFCMSLDIDYIGVPRAINTNTIGDFALRQNPSGNIDIGVIRSDKVHMLEFELGVGNNYLGFNTLDTTENNWSIVSDNDYFITENNTGWNFIDGNNVITEFDHNIANHSAFITKKAGAYHSDDGIINLIHKGFDGSFNYRVYKTQCNTQLGNCSPSEEIFTNDRDITQDVRFGTVLDVVNDEVITVGVKTDASGEVKREKKSWSDSLNDSPLTIWEENHPLYPLFDCLIIAVSVAIGDDEESVFINDETTLQSRSEDSGGNPIITDVTLDLDEDGMDDEFMGVVDVEITDDEATHIVYALLVFVGDRTQLRVNQYRGINTDPERSFNSFSNQNNEIQQAQFNNPPPDIFIRKISMIQYSDSELLIALLTNYGLLVKSGIDISQFTLSDNDVELSENETTLFPNPSKDKVSFSNKNIHSVTVYDINGRLVSTAQSNIFSIKGLNAGIYIVKAQLENGSEIIKKIIKN
ncbi:T9SS type A sorting domain-containing protein [Winogradskyella ouciana]|uniref:T9SS type A sorting domain-containing protein n=1 Tax=Winogradskyella ouciana TaxID=2608631 RepID=UPI003D2C4EEC